MSHKLGKAVVFVMSVLLINFGNGNVYAGQPDKKLNSILKGDYAFTLWRSCVETPEDGIAPNTLQLKTYGKKVDFVDTGAFRFDGKGNLSSVRTRIIQMSPDQLEADDFPIINNLESSCKGTYSVDSDLSYTSELTCKADLGTGYTLKITPFRGEGQISDDKKVIVYSEVAGNLQTETISIGDVTVQTQDRICISSGTLIKTVKLK